MVSVALSWGESFNKMKKRLDKLPEENFYVFNIPIKSGRQNPESLAGALLLGPIFIVGLLFLANMFVFTGSSQQAPTSVMIICIIIDVLGFIITLLSFIYSFKAVYKTRQSTQYLISIVLSQFLFGRLLFWISLYMILDSNKFHHDFIIETNEMAIFLIVSYVIGVLCFLISLVYLMKQIEHGRFQENTRKDRRRSEIEENTSIYQKTAIKIGFAISLSIGSLITVLQVNDLTILVVSAIGITVFYTMFFILPEQLVMWYCLKRFSSNKEQIT